MMVQKSLRTKTVNHFLNQTTWHQETCSKLVKQFMCRYQDHCVIFVGYSFFDMDFATVLYGMRNVQDRRGVHWFAVTPRNMNEYSYVRSMYDRRFGILHIDMTFYELMAELQKDFPYLPDKWKPEEIQARRPIHNRCTMTPWPTQRTLLPSSRKR